jgi:TetR/AcrR family transcriptional repressor of nem operon
MSKAERTKKLIVEQTADLFNKKGYSGTSLNDITEATGLTKGSVYGNFSNKDEVALAVFDYNLKRLNAIIRSEMKQYTTAYDKLMVYVRLYTNFFDYPFPAGGCPIQNTAIEADDTHPELRKKASQAILSWKNKIAKLIEDGIDRGEFIATADTEQVALTIIAIIEGGIMVSKLTGKMKYLQTVMVSVEKMINELAQDQLSSK